jgi:hypothetical protein
MQATRANVKAQKQTSRIDSSGGMSVLRVTVEAVEIRLWVKPYGNVALLAEAPDEPLRPFGRDV